MVRFWAIADTHLSFGKPRDMTRFGEKWHNHAERIASAWQACVALHDVVIVAGDISWASSQKRVLPDLEWLAQLNGTKVLLRGNHDHWWKDIQTARQLAEPLGFRLLEGDALRIDGAVVCGAMGHLAPNDPHYVPDPKKDRFSRELARLESALQHGQALRQADEPLLLVMHYPPFTTDGQPTAYSALIARYQPTACLYGHLHHDREWSVAKQGLHDGVQYHLVAADFLEMTPRLVWQTPTERSE
ncbi:MAG: metallophosphoesterase [Anaerolineae bacterium]|nr:metallophosphoesterase [Anaerolineae bacterium]MDW8299815.1 metallophosphoesterase [Anaerolineae bacterium]